MKKQLIMHGSIKIDIIKKDCTNEAQNLCNQLAEMPGFVRFIFFLHVASSIMHATHVMHVASSQLSSDH